MERRARAGDSVGWNASFVRSDTVVDALADRLGVGKSDILDREEVSHCCGVGQRSTTRWDAVTRGAVLLVDGPAPCSSRLPVRLVLVA